MQALAEKNGSICRRTGGSAWDRCSRRGICRAREFAACVRRSGNIWPEPSAGSGCAASGTEVPLREVVLEAVTSSANGIRPDSTRIQFQALIDRRALEMPFLSDQFPVVSWGA